MRAVINFRESGCWEWESYLNPASYGVCTWNGKQGRLAHRVLFEQAYGPIPEGLELHHRCGNTACVRPQHLEVVSRLEHARHHPLTTRTACSRGHEYTPANTYIKPSGHRDCRACIRARVRAYKERLAA